MLVIRLEAVLFPRAVGEPDNQAECVMVNAHVFYMMFFNYSCETKKPDKNRNIKKLLKKIKWIHRINNKLKPCFCVIILIFAYILIQLTTATQSIVTATPLEPEPKTLRSPYLPSIQDNKENKELSTALRRRRDRFARQQEMLNHSNNSINNGIYSTPKSNTTNGTYTNTNGSHTKPNLNGNANGNINGSHYSNGINGHPPEEEYFVNRAAKTFNLADVLNNGLFFLTH